MLEEAVAEELAEEAVAAAPTKTPPTTSLDLAAPDRGRDHGWDRRGEEHRARGVPAHGAATVSSDEIVHHLLAHRPGRAGRARRAVRRRDPRRGRRARPGKIAAIVFEDAESLAFLEALLHPLVSREYLIWREQLAALDDPPRVCVTEVPLLYESGGETRFDRVVVITAPRQLREQRRQVPLDNRDDRLIDDAEKVARADFHYVNTGTFEDLDAWVAGLMAELTNDAS